MRPVRLKLCLWHDCTDGLIDDPASSRFGGTREVNRNLIIAVIIALLLVGCGRSTHPQKRSLEDRVLRFENGFPILAANGILLGKTTTVVERMEHLRARG